MPLPARILLLVFCGICNVRPLVAQLPFYTDDPAVTEAGKLHFEFFNELDALQSSQYPNLRQNTANFKLNYGLPYHLELDVDAPYLSIFRAVGAQNSAARRHRPGSEMELSESFSGVPCSGAWREPLH